MGNISRPDFPDDEVASTGFMEIFYSLVIIAVIQK